MNIDKSKRATNLSYSTIPITPQPHEMDAYFTTPPTRRILDAFST